MYSETHCHLGDITPEGVRKAEEAGLELMITMGLDNASTEAAIMKAKMHRCIKVSVGVHPWYADDFNDETRDRFKSLASNQEVVAVGEIGLDYTGRMNRQWVREEKYVDKEIQRAALRGQIGLAKELGFPVIIHDRAPGQEVLDIIKETSAQKTGAIIHGFSKDAAYVDRCKKLGVYLSMGLRQVQAMTPELEEAIRRIPPRLMVTETDSNKPWDVIQVCDIVGKIKGMSRQEVGLAATRNLKILVGYPPPQTSSSKPPLQR
jgi:TatD DNase family protein